VSNETLTELNAAANRTGRAWEDSNEVAVGALRGLLECAHAGDREAVDILRKIQNAGDDAMRDALTLNFQRSVAYSNVQARLTKQVGNMTRRGYGNVTEA
jgi:hypothetical protein